ncbi:MAG TPA: hypothetical protein DEZ08_07465 [Dehalococcoidia bacterium]|nr:hypothetical protein [Dehalococcoidia bacterium]|tara:strand:+ start:1831 stop:2559 length:729 start_codon:yes stop_codon:yes gene_type:complete
MHILLCDDKDSIENINNILSIAGYITSGSSDGITAIRDFLVNEPDLVITNLKLLYLDGFELIRRIRERSEVPIIALSDNNSVEEKVTAFNSGVTDFLAKPVYEQELLGRVDSCLMRVGKNVTPATKYNDDLIDIDFVKREVKVSGKKCDLTRTEYNLLSLLIKRKSQALSLEFLLANIWGREYDTFDLVKWHVSNLRKKIRLLSDGQTPIVTVRGFGYLYDTSALKIRAAYDVMAGYRNRAG